MAPLFSNLIRTPEDKRDPQIVQNALNKASAAWQTVENHLAQGAFVTGENLTLGDIPLGVWAYRWFNLPIERPHQPKLKNWYERLRQRKPYQTHIMIPLT